MTKPQVVLTRTEYQPHQLGTKFPSIEWLDFPLIKFEYKVIEEEVLDQINFAYDWLVFTSQNGVKSFFAQRPKLTHKKIACVGPKTASLVEDQGFKVDFIPSVYNSLTLAKELPSTSTEKICYIGGNLSSSETLKVLKEKSRQFLQIESYHTVPHMHERIEWEKLLGKNPEVISFCSPSAVNSFVSQLTNLKIEIPSDTIFAAIGSTTAASIEKDLGKKAIVGEQHTFTDMIDAITEYLHKKI